MTRRSFIHRDDGTCAGARWTGPDGGCDSWYLDADGINRALSTGFSFEYWARTRRARRSAYRVNAPA